MLDFPASEDLHSTTSAESSSYATTSNWFSIPSPRISFAPPSPVRCGKPHMYITRHVSISTESGRGRGRCTRTTVLPTETTLQPAASNEVTWAGRIEICSIGRPDSRNLLSSSDRGRIPCSLMLVHQRTELPLHACVHPLSQRS